MLPVKRMQHGWLPTFFNDFFDEGFGKIGNINSPAVNVIESDKEYKVEIAAPGMCKDDFKIRVNEENRLVITMEHKKEDKTEKKDEKFLRREFSYTHYEQTMLLPDHVKKDQIEAKMKHGILKIMIPKDLETPVKEKEVEIKVE